ncbi:MAG: ribosome maturation factor RimM [Candidatus Glassbacteria bacterium]
MEVNYVVVGRVISAHGIHGKMIIEPMTENPHRFEEGSKLCIESENGKAKWQVTVRGAAPYKGKLLVRVSEITDRTEAARHRGRYICVPVEDLPEPEPGEYYHHQLVGLQAVDVAGEILGIVCGVVPMPAQDVIVVEKSGKEFMVPFVDEFIKEVDLEGQRIIIKRMAGLFEEA